MLAQVYGADLSWETIADMLRDLADGLAFLHGCGHTLPAFKLDDVFVTQEWSSLIADLGFGAAPFVSAADTGACAPELLVRGGGRADERANVFSLGCIALQLLTQAAPPQRVAADGFAFRDAQLSSLPADCPPALVTVMKQCLRTDPAARPPATVLLRQLNQLAEAARNGLLSTVTIAPHASLAASAVLPAALDANPIHMEPLPPLPPQRKDSLGDVVVPQVPLVASAALATTVTPQPATAALAAATPARSAPPPARAPPLAPSPTSTPAPSSAPAPAPSFAPAPISAVSARSAAPTRPPRDAPVAGSSSARTTESAPAAAAASAPLPQSTSKARAPTGPSPHARPSFNNVAVAASADEAPSVPAAAALSVSTPVTASSSLPLSPSKKQLKDHERAEKERRAKEEKEEKEKRVKEEKDEKDRRRRAKEEEKERERADKKARKTEKDLRKRAASVASPSPSPSAPASARPGALLDDDDLPPSSGPVTAAPGLGLLAKLSESQYHYRPPTDPVAAPAAVPAPAAAAAATAAKAEKKDKKSSRPRPKTTTGTEMAAADRRRTSEELHREVSPRGVPAFQPPAATLSNSQGALRQSTSRSPREIEDRRRTSEELHREVTPLSSPHALPAGIPDRRPSLPAVEHVRTSEELHREVSPRTYTGPAYASGPAPAVARVSAPTLAVAPSFVDSSIVGEPAVVEPKGKKEHKVLFLFLMSALFLFYYYFLSFQFHHLLPLLTTIPKEKKEKKEKKEQKEQKPNGADEGDKKEKKKEKKDKAEKNAARERKAAEKEAKQRAKREVTLNTPLYSHAHKSYTRSHFKLMHT